MVWFAKHRLPAPVRRFFLVTFLLDALALLCEKYAKLVLHLGFPYSSIWLHDPRAYDLMFAVPLFRHVHTADFFSHDPFPFMYPAALAPVFGLLLTTPRPWITLDICIAIIGVAAAFLFGKALRFAGLCRAQSIFVPVGLVCLSYPLGFDIKQGNTEIFVWVLIATGIWLFLKDKLQAAAFFIGCAIAMKIFPFVYLGLFLARRRFTPIVTALVTAAGVTLLSLHYLGPTISIAWHGTASNLMFYQQAVPLSYRPEIGYDHSIFAFLKTGVHLMAKPMHFRVNFQPLLRGYLLIAAVAGIALYFVRIRMLPTINQIFCLTLCSILLPPTSYDYTLLHLYIPLAILILFAVRHQAVHLPGLNLMFIGLAMATAIETEFIVHHRTIGAQIKCVVLVMLLVAALRYPLPAQRAIAADGPSL